MNPPTTEIAIALADAEVPEEQINFELLEEVRLWLDAPIDGSIKYVGFTDNGNRYTPQSVVVARCVCGWYDFFESLADAPTHCPKCKAFIPENPIT